MDLSSQSQQLNDTRNRDQLQYILSERIGYGYAQTKLSIPLNVLLFTQGCQSVVIGLLLTQLEQQWHVTNFQKSLLITLVYIGVSLGSYLQSFSDDIGRSVFIKWNGILQLIFGILSCVATNMTYFIVFRFIYGIGIGIVIPLSATYMSEIAPSTQRSSILTKSRVYWASGCLATFIIAWYLLYSHQWRLLLFLICIPGAYALYEHLANGKQSLRYLWIHKKVDQTTELINYMAVLNERKPINKQEIVYLMYRNQEKKPQCEFRQLLAPKYKKMTIFLLIAWFSVCFIYYGIFLLLPTILSRNQKTSYNFKYMYLIAVTVVQIICFYLSKKLMDHPNFGRKKTIYMGFFVIGLSSFLLIIFGEENIQVLMSSFLLMKVFITMTIMTLFPYSAEIYSTLLRGKAMGIFNVAGRMAIAILGFLGVSALYWFDGKGLYMLFALFSFASFGFMYNMPFCTLGRHLDI